MTNDDAALEVENADSAVEGQQEKMLPQSRVEELVRKAKLKGRDSMQEELEALKRENEELKTKSSGMGGMPAPVDTEALRKQVMQDLVSEFQARDEKVQQENLQKEAERLANEYHGKISGGKEQFEDFDEVMADFNPQAFPEIVLMATQADNTAAIMYDLAKNPQKLAQIALYAERDPRYAQLLVNKLSTSIKANEQAKAQEKNVNAPLSRLQSSPTGQDSGDLDIRDFKRMFRG
jgi:FtsZ-binding cell division protein ZapB